MDTGSFMQTVLLLSLAWYATGQRDVNFCPMTWIPIYGHCHKFGNDVLDFHTARGQCLKMGGDLVAITSAGTLRHLRERMPEHSLNLTRPSFWTGLQKHKTSESTFTWKWTDGTPSDFFLKSYSLLPGNGSAVWMDEEEFGIAEVDELKPYICQRNMLNIGRQYCSGAICVKVLGYGANHSGESSRQECLLRGSDIPFEGGDNRDWEFLKSLLSLYKMDQPVWVRGRNGQYRSWTSVFDNSTSQHDYGRTVCVTNNYYKYKVPQCPCRWGEWNNKCYFVAGQILTGRSFAESAIYCHTNSSRLATINTLEEFNYFKRDFRGIDSYRTYWIDRGTFQPTIPIKEDNYDITATCTMLNLLFDNGKVLEANIEERDCSEKHHFICEKDLQTDLSKSVCKWGMFKQVCYHRSSTSVPSTGVSCERGQQLTLSMLNVHHLNTKGTPVNNALLWNLTSSTGCLAYWIRNGKINLRFQPARRFSLFYISGRYKSKEETRPYICVTEHLLLSVKLGIGIGVILAMLAFMSLLGVVWFMYCSKKTDDEIYAEVDDHKPVLPPKDHPMKINTTIPNFHPREIFFQKNDAYVPFPESNDTELHM